MALIYVIVLDLLCLCEIGGSLVARRELPQIFDKFWFGVVVVIAVLFTLNLASWIDAHIDNVEQSSGPQEAQK